jgi:undecaprenyl diphosphate synthase
VLNVAANYGGQWDIVQAVKSWQQAHPEKALGDLTAQALSPFLSAANQPEPDLLIRTGGESRISNFMLWQLAYAELYFTDVLWPDFNVQQLLKALDWFAARERRFGAVSAR